MPYNRPGPGVYLRNGTSLTIRHGTAATQAGFVGVAVKQRARSWRDGFDVQAIIDRSEPYYLITKGVVQVSSANITSPAKGDGVYIIAADNRLTKTATSNVPFGTIVEVAGERGTPTGFVRIDLDDKPAAAS